jgi:cell division protein FtsL
LQVNRFTVEKTRLEEKIELAKQRIIKLKAEEMQLTTPDRIRRLATGKFGMIVSNGENEFLIKR